MPSAPDSTGPYACLVGELREADPQWQQIIDGIQMLCPELTSPDCHRLPAGDVFIRGLSKEAWRIIHGQTQQLNGGGHILWRRPLPTDGAFPTPTTIRRMEARGVPFGLRNWRLLERLVRPVGSLRKIVSNGLHSGDPSCICIDVEMATDMDVPRKISAAVRGIAGPEIHLTVLPTPPSLPTGLHSAASSDSTPQSAPCQLAQEQKTPKSDGIPHHIPSPTPRRPHPAVPADTPQGEGMSSLMIQATASPTMQTTPALREDDAPRPPLSVYYSRRRYRSSPASTRDTRSWISRHEEHQRASTRSPPNLDGPGPPSASQGPPGT